MNDLPKINSLDELHRLEGKAVPVSTFAFFSGRNPKTVYQRITRRTLPACYLGGLLCVLVKDDAPQLDGPPTPDKCD